MRPLSLHRNHTHPQKQPPPHHFQKYLENLEKSSVQPGIQGSPCPEGMGKFVKAICPVKAIGLPQHLMQLSQLPQSHARRQAPHCGPSPELVSKFRGEASWIFSQTNCRGGILMDAISWCRVSGDQDNAQSQKVYSTSLDAAVRVFCGRPGPIHSLAKTLLAPSHRRIRPAEPS